MPSSFFDNLHFQVTEEHQEILEDLLNQNNKSDTWTRAKSILINYPVDLTRAYYTTLFDSKPQPTWMPTEYGRQSNLQHLLKTFDLETYQELYESSVNEPEDYWATIIEKLQINFHKEPDQILDLTKGPEHPTWLSGARLNIVDTILANTSDEAALVWMSEESQQTTSISHKELKEQVLTLAAGLQAKGLRKGDAVALYCPMTKDSICLYLAIVLAGLQVVSIPDSFPAKEVQKRLDIVPCKLVATVESYLYGGKQIGVASKLEEVNHNADLLLLDSSNHPIHLTIDQLRHHAASSFDPVDCSPYDTTNVLFSSGTTSAPKAIPWNHIAPIKAAGDGYAHHDIQEGDVVTWTTGMGWMMAPWLIYASLLNKATLAFFEGSAAHPSFGRLVQDAEVSMLGTIPSLVNVWERTKAMEPFNWNVKVFSSTGEPSNPSSYLYLSYLGKHNAPIIEYCGGTEIGGGYVTSSILLPNVLSHFNTQALGTSFVLLNENKQSVETETGEVFLVPPSLGSSQSLLNKDHHQVYYKNQPEHNGRALRKHGDALEIVSINNETYYRSAGRTDDTMNLGGIKTSSIEIEEVVLTHPDVTECAAISIADGGPEKLVVFLTGEPQDDITADLQGLIRSKLNPLFKISKVKWIDALPRTASNKIKRRSLKDLV